ncbi:hypothetical protein M501DRAFT_1006046 [Patellaria atrata CBS 101060]|uniref:F-box domain-containing protein n=1 Tax=Patellaria atrata CBS 101060 TaxID=1346257 RepID=A0A9P4VTS9_9PEZI|nr:hypothetical protein M501DRAFT_1006046 [Patellaria atrata CBS 101060]
MKKLPTEVYENICDYLSRDDLKAMRLSCSEFDRMMAQVLFETAVVPFNTEIYDMVKSDQLTVRDVKGPGVDVFKGFGHRIKRFGMSFEVNGNVLARPPSKGSRDLHSSFWGEYEWPFEEYQRYEAIAGLEHAADESPKMRTAFSYLTGVKHLALSLDSGLGWLNGPDLSIHAKVFRRPPPVFYSQRRCPERKLEAQKQLWDYLSRSHTEAAEDGAEGKARANMTIPKESQGVLYTMATISNARDRQLYRKPRFTPGTLSSAQIEWLLETDWAQRAFLSSYMLAVMDNPPIFASIRSLTFARLSSQFLPLLMRNDFWDALSSLNTFSLNVIPIWRHIMKDEAGYVTSQAINPSHSITPCYLFLSTIIAPRSNIKHLTVGWADGGENAQGLFSRNMHLLPSPVISREHSLSEEDEFEMVHFPHLENLILSNCWLGSSALMSLVNIHKTMSLKELTLDSVSLAIWPPPEPGQTLATGLPGVYLQHHATGPAQPPYLPPWQGTPREESWPHVIDVISPGRKLADDGKDVPAYPPADMEIEGNSAPDSVLQRITFISCGYAQVGLVDNLRRIRSSQDPYLKHRFREDFFRRRYFMLDSCMMKVSERYFGYIVQHMPDSELERLAAVWDLREGWDDAEKAEEAKFDGLLPGGTGRFSGVVERVI